jgi:hypothetical protein
MTNDIFLKGFWPPEAKVTVDLGLIPPLEKSFSFLYNPGMNKRQTKNGFLLHLKLAPGTFNKRR